MSLSFKRLRERGQLVTRLREKLAAARKEISALDEYAREIRKELEALRCVPAELAASREHAAKLAARLRAVDGDRLRAENADLQAENARLRAEAPAVSREEYLRLEETNARLARRLEDMQAGRVTM
ncbi:hypothetical protein ACFWYW_46525 [Nonomuraea sp. NPDC059023]|uniref:hypothetical protein n=1 Tax=unclassified Nonomuraea TaxID=2593643 RepID=UPI003697108D